MSLVSYKVVILRVEVCSMVYNMALSICRILQLMSVIDARLAQRGCEKLDLALLYFIEQFRKIYIGEQVQRTSKVRYI